MKLLKKIFFILIFLLPITNSFGAMFTHNQTASLDAGSLVAGVAFNSDGTKVFTSSANDRRFINEFSLSIPYDISSKTYVGDSERCNMGEDILNNDTPYDLEFSNNGMHFFIVTRNAGHNIEDGDKAFRFDLTTPYDISTCVFDHRTENLDQALYNNGSNGGDFDYEGNKKQNRLQGIEISNDGSKLFLIWMKNVDTTIGARLLEYTLSTPYDLRTLSLVNSAGIEFAHPDSSSPYVENPGSLRFSPNGKRIFITSHAEGDSAVTQVSFTNPFDSSSFVIDGTVNINNLTPSNNEPRGLDFGINGIKLIIANDFNENGLDQLMEYDLVCPYNLFEGKCDAITEGDRTGMAEAQMELARRTIDHSTNSALNRLKWIRRNKDKQDLTNLQIDIDFSNQMLASLTEAVKTSVTKKNKPFKDKNVFYWSEGSISVGKMGDTNVSTSKEINANSLTIGADKFTENNGIIGWALRYGNDHTKVGYNGSNMNADTFNLTLYNTRPSSIDNKYIDTIFGIGKIDLDILNLLDGVKLTAKRSGRQMYGTVKLKDEIIKNTLTIIPSAQIDFGHTILDSYKETGISAMSFKKQHVKSRNLRAAIAAVDKIENEKYSIKRHGKLEYQANLKRSSNIKYTYVDEPSNAFNTKLQSGSLHNINGEVGIDIIFPENYSLFIIYERKQAISQGNFNKGHSTGYTDNFYIALGYLPGKNTEYAFTLNGSENLMSKLEIKKDINGFDLSFNLNDDLTRLGDAREAYIELNKVF